MTATLLSLALLAAAEAPDWFRVYQYAQVPARLRGCSECQGEPDDVCEVRPGAQSRPLDEYAQKAAPSGRVNLLRSKADPDCAVYVKTLFAGKGQVELAAIRIARAPVSAQLVDRFAVKSAVAGWPRAPQRRKGQHLVAAAPDRSALRAAVVCWASERGWPSVALDPRTSCELWLLPLRGDGEPDVAARSFPLVARRDHWPEAFPFGDARWSAVFDPARPFDESALLGEEPRRPEPAPSPSVKPAQPVPQSQPSLARCGEAARSRTALLERFEQWERQVIGARGSLDRSAWAIDAAAWSGHCSEMEVLRAALEDQLGCGIVTEGSCVGPSAQVPR
jgi:hypothetical protein